MKHPICLLAIIMLIMSSTLSAEAKRPALSPKEKAQIEKEAFKEAKKTAKDLKKQGWIIEQTGIMENILCRHLVQLRTYGLEEQSGSAENKKSRSICRKKILNDVSNDYARKQSQVVAGKLTTEDVIDDEEEMEKFVGEYTARLAKEIAGELKKATRSTKRTATVHTTWKYTILSTPMVHMMLKSEQPKTPWK